MPSTFKMKRNDLTFFHKAVLLMSELSDLPPPHLVTSLRTSLSQQDPLHFLFVVVFFYIICFQVISIYICF